MVTFVPSFLSEGDEATIAQVADHIDHIATIAGVDHVGIGSDFDGIISTPVGLGDVSKFPALFAELSRRGWSEGGLAKLAGDNILRVMNEAETVAPAATEGTSDRERLIEELRAERAEEQKAAAEAAQEAEAAAWLENKRASEAEAEG